jgi:cytochrome c peroxidase
MEANFSLFFGLAVQMYESTLVSDETPFDRFVEGDPDALTERQQRGMNRFQSGGANCVACHIGAELTGASVSETLNPLEPAQIEVMAMADGGTANYDQGFYNIGVRPTSEDIGRGGTDPFGNPLSFSRQLGIKVGILPGSLTFDPGLVPDFGCTPAPSEIPPTICPPPGFVTPRFNVDGTFKTPGLRNVELTGPYFHNGGTLTLRQVMDFYVRGSDFSERNIDNLDPFHTSIGALIENIEGVEEVVDFLLALTDERVRMEMAPFDHPQLFVPNGHSNQKREHPKLSKRTPAPDELLEIPAVGALGRAAEGLLPLKPFLADDLEGNVLANFHFQP